MRSDETTDMDQMIQEFDNYVDEYADQHRNSIRLSGEDPAFFAEYKIRALAVMAGKWGMSAPRILDFGSGIGNSVPHFRACFPDAVTTQSDLSAESLARARTLYGGPEPQLLIENDRIPANDQSFDLVFTACVFHHIPHDQHIAWLGELLRVTSPGGRLVIFEHNPWNPLTRHAVANCPFDVNAHLISAPVMARRLREAGWQNTETSYHVFFPAALSGLRRIESRLEWCPLGAQYSSAGRAPGA